MTSTHAPGPSRPPEVAEVALGDGRLIHGFVEDHRVWFAYLSNQMGGYGEARARELTLALGRAFGT